MYVRVFVMIKEVSRKQMQLDLLSTTNLYPSAKAAWETLKDTTVRITGYKKGPATKCPRLYCSSEGFLSGPILFLLRGVIMFHR